MTRTQMIVRKRTQGQVSFNDGEFVEVEVSGTEGTDDGLFLDTIQFHRDATPDSPEEFKHRFPVGTHLDIDTITTVAALPSR